MQSFCPRGGHISTENTEWAKQCSTSTTRHSKDCSFNKKVISAVKPITGREVNKRSHRHGEKNEHSRKQKWDVYEAPLCLEPTCGENGKGQYISNYDISNRATEDYLLEQYEKAKKARWEDQLKPLDYIRRIIAAPTSPHSSFFKATFGEAKIGIDVFADQGADTNLTSSSIL